MAALAHVGESYHYLMAMQVINYIVFFVITILIIIQFIAFYRQIKKNHATTHHASSKHEALNRKVYIANICTIICFFCWSLQSFISITTSFGVFINQANCKPTLWFHFALYYIAMLSKWFVFITRLAIIYHGSVYAHSRKCLTVFVCILFGWIIALLTTTFIDIQVHYVIVGNLHLCAFTLTKLVLILLNISDILLSVIIMILFINPIYQLSTNIDETDKNAQTKKMKHFSRWKRLIFKYFTTTFIATLSTTLLAILVILIGNGKLIAIDNMINAFCLCLMCTAYDKYFNCICCGMVIALKPIFNILYGKLLSAELKSYGSSTDLEKTYPGSTKDLEVTYNSTKKQSNVVEGPVSPVTNVASDGNDQKSFDIVQKDMT
eukprot:306080_1